MECTDCKETLPEVCFAIYRTVGSIVYRRNTARKTAFPILGNSMVNTDSRWNSLTFPVCRIFLGDRPLLLTTPTAAPTWGILGSHPLLECTSAFTSGEFEEFTYVERNGECQRIPLRASNGIHHVHKRVDSIVHIGYTMT